MQAEVIKFLRDPDNLIDPPVFLDPPAADTKATGESETGAEVGGDGEVVAKKPRKKKEEYGKEKIVDVVLSDMCAPWDQTDGFWKKSLSDPYLRMMNTSGIAFKDHAGSMVCPLLSP